jgi:hypothetical protein
VCVFVLIAEDARRAPASQSGTCRPRCAHVCEFACRCGRACVCEHVCVHARACECACVHTWRGREGGRREGGGGYSPPRLPTLSPVPPTYFSLQEGFSGSRRKPFVGKVYRLCPRNGLCGGDRGVKDLCVTASKDLCEHLGAPPRAPPPLRPSSRPSSSPPLRSTPGLSSSPQLLKWSMLVKLVKSGKIGQC